MTEQDRKVCEYFQGQGFLPIDKTSYPLFKKHESRNSLQEAGAVMLVTWSYNYRGLYRLIHGYLCAVYLYEGRPVYCTIHRPLEDSAYSLQQIVDVLFELFREGGFPFLQVRMIEEQFVKEYETLEGYKITTECREDSDEYIYRIEDLLKLSGESNYYKRKRLKVCFAEPGISLRPMTRGNVCLCLKIEEEWCGRRDCGYCASFYGCEKQALKTMVDIFDEEYHRGLLLYQYEKPVGYIICERINEKLAYLYYGKANLPGFFVYMIYMMFKEYLTGVEYMNISEDMGHEGLRRFKSKLGPHEKKKKYFCTYRQTERD
jgi:hypothetical protein